MADPKWLKVPPPFKRSQNQPASLADTRLSPCPLLSPPWWEWHWKGRAQLLHCCYTFATLAELWESLDGLFHWKKKKKLVCNWEIHFQWICYQRSRGPGSSAGIKSCPFHGKSGECVQWSRYGLLSAGEFNLLVDVVQSPLCLLPARHSRSGRERMDSGITLGTRDTTAHTEPASEPCQH